MRAEIESISNVMAGVRSVEHVALVATINPTTGLPGSPDGSDAIVYNPSLVANQVVEVNPMSYAAFGTDQYIINQTNVAAGTAFYPSSAGFKTIPYRKFMLFDYSFGTGATVTNLLQISPDSTFAAPVNLLLQNVTDGTTTATIVDAGATGKAFDVLDLCPCYMRICSITAGATNTVKMALTGMSL
jgi:hypothetical protein